MAIKFSKFYTKIILMFYLWEDILNALFQLLRKQIYIFHKHNNMILCKFMHLFHLDTLVINTHQDSYSVVDQRKHASIHVLISSVTDVINSMLQLFNTKYFLKQ